MTSPDKTPTPEKFPLTFDEAVRKWADGEIDGEAMLYYTFKAKEDAERRFAQGREEVIEECAKLCDALEGDGSKPTDRLIGYSDCAQAIRFLRAAPPAK